MRSRSASSRIARALLLALLLLLSAEALIRTRIIAPGAAYNYPHLVRFWDHVPNLRGGKNEVHGVLTLFTFNSMGFRSEEIPREKARGEKRILCLGDSATFGFGVPQDATYPARLQSLERAHRSGQDVTVINAGVEGYTSFQGLGLLEEKGLATQPDIVTVAFIWNDGCLDIASDRERSARAGINAMRALLYRSELYLSLRNLVMNPVYHPVPREKGTVPRVSGDEFEGNLRAMHRMLKSAGAQMVIVSMPSRPTWREEATGIDYEGYRKVMRRLSAMEGIPLIDLHRRWRAPEFDRFFLDLVHPGADGHDRLAREIFRFLEERPGQEGAKSRARVARLLREERPPGQEGAK